MADSFGLNFAYFLLCFFRSIRYNKRSGFM